MVNTRLIPIADQTLTDAGTITLSAADLTKTFKGTLLYTVTATNVSGTTAGNCQLQGSLDGVTWINIGSTVAIVAASTVAVPAPTTDNAIPYSYYRVSLTGSGTQSTTIGGKYLIKEEV